MSCINRVVACLGLLLSLDAMDSGAYGGKSVDRGKQGAVGVRIELDLVSSKPYARKGPIPVLVELINDGQEDVLACLDVKGQQVGFVEFQIFDDAGKKVRLLSRIDAEVPISEEMNLVLLRPGERRARLMDLTYGGALYDFTHDEYSLVGIYRCGFKGTRVAGGKTVGILADVLQSDAVSLKVR